MQCCVRWWRHIGDQLADTKAMSVKASMLFSEEQPLWNVLKISSVTVSLNVECRDLEKWTFSVSTLNYVVNSVVKNISLVCSIINISVVSILFLIVSVEKLYKYKLFSFCRVQPLNLAPSIYTTLILVFIDIEKVVFMYTIFCTICLLLLHIKIIWLDLTIVSCTST